MEATPEADGLRGERQTERVSDPYCLACGGLVGFEDIYGSRGRKISPDDVELDPTNPLEWGGIYRAVFQRRPGYRFQLSGTGRYDDHYLDLSFGDRLKVTWGRESSNINQPKLDDFGEPQWFIYELNFLNSNNRKRYPRGHVVHASCWILIERLFGPEVENNLELLLEICRERFHENPYDIHEYLDRETLEPTSQPTCRWWNPLETGPSLDQNRHHSDVQKDPRQSIPLRDPLVIPEIDRLIKHSAQNKVREATKRKTRKWSSLIAGSSSLSSERRRSPQYHQVVELSCDLVLLIIDNLSCHTDIRNALIAFNWNIPEEYWKSRVSTDLIFELPEQKQNELDWKTLGLGVIQLMEQPSLRNRKRVLELLSEIRRRFWGRMTEPDRSMVEN